jgi:hypothetical protein
MTGQEYDVVVVGSGAAGMVAALTAAHEGLSTVVVEKAPHYGGSTARSGGGVWIPNNEILRRDGVTDTPEAARAYLHGIIGDIVEPERIDAYLKRAPEMLSFVLAHTPLKMCWVPGYSDYYPEAAGGRPGGRSIEPKPFDANRLGPDAADLEPPSPRVASQPEGRRADDVGEGDRQEPGRDGARVDRTPEDWITRGRRSGAPQHRVDRSPRRGRRRAWRICSRYERA